MQTKVIETTVKQETPPPRRAAKGKRAQPRRIPVWYKALVALSAVIVLLFAVYKITVRPPEFAQAAPEIPLVPLNTTQGAQTGEGDTQQAETPAPLVRRENVYNFVLFGVDATGGNTDTIMVGSYDTVQQRAALISIPRDSMIDSEKSNKKVNATYAYGGTDGLVAALEDMLGIPIDFYCRVNLSGFVKLVNAVGGVEFYVPVDMHYEDPTQNLYIHLTKGMQTLNGEKALQLVRCRNAYASQDIGRMETQQAFLKALAKKALTLGNVTKLASVASENLKTDLKLENIVWFGEQLLSLNMDDLHMQTLPYANASHYYKGTSYLLLDPDAVLEMVNEYLNPYTTDLTAEHLNIMAG